MKKLKGTQVSVAYKLLMDTLNLPVAKWIYYNLKQNVKALSPSNKAIEAKREEMFKWLKRLDTGAFDPEDETVQNTERDFTSRLEKEEYKIEFSRLPMSKLVALSVFQIMLLEELMWDNLDITSLHCDSTTKLLELTHEDVAQVSYYLEYLAKIPNTQAVYIPLSKTIKNIEQVWKPIAKQYLEDYNAIEDKAIASEKYNEQIKNNKLVIEVSSFKVPESDYINWQQIFILQDILGDDIIIYWEEE